MNHDSDAHRPQLAASRRDLLKWSAIGGAALGVSGLLAACSEDKKEDAEETTGATTSAAVAAAVGAAGSFPKTPEWNFVFVNHVTTNPFFTPTQYGIDDACKLLGVKSQWQGSETAKTNEMVDAMNNAIAGKADGIAVCLTDLEAFNEPTQKALAANIPVLAYNADAPNERLAYVGQDLFGSGVEMGKRIVELVKEGEVALFIATPGQLNIQPRIDGAIEAIKQSKAPITFKQITTGPELPEEVAAVEAAYLGNKNIKGMFAVDAGSTQAVGQIMEKHKLKDAGMFGGGYDLLPDTLRLIDAGILDFTIDQLPYLQGFLPVLYLYLYKLSGGVAAPPMTNTGLKFVVKDNVGTYLKTESRFEGDSKDQKLVEAPA